VLTCHLLPVYSGNVTADGGSAAPYPPPGGPFATPPGQSVPPPTAFAPGGGRPRGAGLAIALGIVAILVAVAALVVALVRGGESSPPASPTAQPSTSSTAASADTSAADKALCEAVGPLLRESIDSGKAFVNLGLSGTPERDGGIPGYRAQVEDWVSRIQPILDAHADPSRYLTRTLQQFIDYTRAYAENIRPGPAADPDGAAWNNRVIAYGGPFEVCHKLGVNW